jgi:hypothetical protein
LRGYFAAGDTNVGFTPTQQVLTGRRQAKLFIASSGNDLSGISQQVIERRDKVAKQLSEWEIAKEQERANEWLPRHSKPSKAIRLPVPMQVSQRSVYRNAGTLLFSRSVPFSCLYSSSRCLNCFMQFVPQHLGRRQYGEIFGHVDARGAEFQQLDLFCFLAGAENDAQRQVLFGFPLVLSQPA